MGLTKEDREVLDALENAGKLYERYLELSRIADLTPDKREKEPGPPPPPPTDFGFRKRPIGVVVNLPESVANGYLG